jgi:putative DNA primase/helicase
VLDSEINPPGINLKNGVLQFSYNDGPEVRLVDHSPEIIYTYKPEVEYKPDCDQTAAQKLLEVLEDKYRTATTRTLSAALHLDLVRRKKGRIVRAMFFNGGGNNGKDSLREAITQIFSRSGVTSIGLKDFQLYDEGKKFGVAQLLGSRLNISSENKASLNIDELQSLKQAGSGDPLICEKKGVDGEEFIPSCVLVFSTNDTTVNLTASLEAISSRYVVVPFRKTYTDNPTKSNELKADPRFKYDPEWVRSDVCPGLLNIMVEEFKAIFEEGIDYSPFAEAMEKNRVDANHLCRFGIDSGLVEDVDGWVSNQDLEIKLRIWYEAEGVLKIDDSGREYWAEDVRAGDPWVRGTPQYKKRFSRIFPGITSQKKSDVRGIRGLRFASPAEEPLRKVETYGDYLAVEKLLGQAEIDRAWPYLLPEERNRIIALAPITTDPEPLAESDMQAEIAILIEAAESGEVEAMEHFIGLPERHKKQIWESTPPELIPKVKELVSTCRSQIYG